MNFQIGLLGHPPWPVWSAVNSSGIQQHLHCIHRGSFYSET